ncbi:hypothetical protein LOAG_01294 [Loa loa]|uniref:Uncharacterized protein n=1 Tax=Loa loa TaxID=7209 RepID=A0A1S0U975_LOALO|nr:hypothetical protein LOAG_01294 [Loa loa]EFO27188.1 hypothetical protein LOAG_01294 [Loa loa]
MTISCARRSYGEKLQLYNVSKSHSWKTKEANADPSWGSCFQSSLFFCETYVVLLITFTLYGRKTVPLVVANAVTLAENMNISSIASFHSGRVLQSNGYLTAKQKCQLTSFTSTLMNPKIPILGNSDLTIIRTSSIFGQKLASVSNEHSRIEKTQTKSRNIFCKVQSVIAILFGPKNGLNKKEAQQTDH